MARTFHHHNSPVTKGTLKMLPSQIMFLLILITIPGSLCKIQSSQASTKTMVTSNNKRPVGSCSAGVIFLKTFNDTHATDKLVTALPIITSSGDSLSSSSSSNNNHGNNSNKKKHALLNGTYVLQVSYPCNSSPLPRIEKLKKSVRDPFVSFYLVTGSNGGNGGGSSNGLGVSSSSKSKRAISEYGSGDYDDDDDDDDEDDDEEEEEEDEDEGVDRHGGGGGHDNHGFNNHFTTAFEVEDDDDEDNMIEPSNHVMLTLPTPTIEMVDMGAMGGGHNGLNPVSVTFYPELSSPAYSLHQGGSPPPPPAGHISPTRSWGYNNMVVGVTPSIATADDNDGLLFSSPVGSGDGPVVQVTPVWNPISSSSSSPTTTTDDEGGGRDGNNNGESYVSSVSPSTTSSSSYDGSPVVTTTPQLRAHLLHPIPKQLIYSGVQHQFSIPGNTFQPECSGGYEIENPEPWVEITSRNVVKFFPQTSHISDYTLRVICRPFGSIAEMFVSVRQRQKSRLHNHAFVLQFGMMRGQVSRVELLGRIVDEIRKEVDGGGGSTTNSNNDLVVLSTELDSYPFRITYVNESIISNVCPTEQLKEIYGRLQRVGGFIKLESVKLQIPPDSNQCDSSVVGTVTGESHHGNSNHHAGVSYGENFPPTIKNQIDRLNGTVGEYLVYNVKDDFCYDPEDGGTRNLGVMLKTNELAEIKPDYWLQWDTKNQEFYGLPMATERTEFVLVCTDRGGKSANDVLELEIVGARTPPSHFNTEFNLHFQSVPFSPKAVRRFIEKLSAILSPQIQVHSFAESNGHVLFKWFNTSNPSSELEVTQIRKVMLSDDGPVSKRLYEHFAPEFNVTVASVIPLRGMLSENNPVEDKGVGGADHGTYLTTYLIPSVLIAIMILLALIIACLLSRKNKYTQASTEDDSPNARVYLKNAKKGVPVIFQDELDEKLFAQNGGRQGGGGGGGARGGGGGDNTPGGRGSAAAGNIYEPASATSPRPPPSVHHTPDSAHPPHHGSNPRVMSPHLRGPGNGTHHHNPHHAATPQPPDYQNSISRSMLRGGRGPGGGGGIPTGGVGVYPNTHHHHQHHTGSGGSHHGGGGGGYGSGGGGGPYSQIDSYAPPPGINYYGIHTSNSGGSGFSGISERGGGGRDSASMTPQHPLTPQQQQQQSQHHHHPHHHHASSKMPPPPYVPP